MNKTDMYNISIIAEEGSLSRASSRLFISQPALSRCLQKVEEELGEKLFRRTPAGLTLTYSGECFLNSAYKILKYYNDLEMEFCEINNMRKGTLNLGSAEKVATMILPQILPAYQKIYPSIKINLLEYNSYLLEEKLINGSIDIATLCLPIKSDKIDYEIFYQDPLYLAIPGDYPVHQYAVYKDGIKGPFLDIRHVMDYNFILTNKHKKTRQAAEQIIQQAGIIQPYMVSQSIETVIGFVANGMGISIVPQIYTRIYNTGDRIKYYHIDGVSQAYWSMAVAYCKDNSLTKPAKEFLKLLKETSSLFPDYIRPNIFGE
ncbi:MAG: LysR family transcriptional regulator [Lachnospiraceae bacterium]|nr:LysR family transcriptional regulator [Lachnospiraceae bacterium]